MTNFEKYKDELMKTKENFGFSKTKQKIGVCAWVNNNIETVKCEDCLFDEPSICCCDSEKIKWLYKEADEPVLTNNELELIKALNKATGKEWKYILRTISNKILIFCNNSRTVMMSSDFANSLYYSNEDYIVIDENNKTLFKNIKFDDRIYDIKNKKFIKIK
jgi:hypothetical protein